MVICGSSTQNKERDAAVITAPPKRLVTWSGEAPELGPEGGSDGERRAVAGVARMVALLSELDAMALREDEAAPHVVLIVDDELGPGPAAGPFQGAVPAFVAAEQLEAALNDGRLDPPVRTQVVRLFCP